MSMQDAIIFASIVGDLRLRDRLEEKCFVSRNSNDFGDRDIGAELQAFGCRYISRFTDALGFAMSRLPHSST